MKALTLAPILAAFLLTGCSGGDTGDAIETKPEAAKLDMPKEQQDRIAQQLKTWAPHKDAK